MFPGIMLCNVIRYAFIYRKNRHLLSGSNQTFHFLVLHLMKVDSSTVCCSDNMF
jgi:hypothetical protein